MNFLAHLHLANATPESAVGNLMPDFVRVRRLDELDPDVREGVLSHRAVDAFVDTHPAYLRSRAMLRDACDHFAPILVDVFNDHLLAMTWADWHEQPLEAFTTGCYRRLAVGAYLMPPRMRRPIAMMIEQDWLGSYATLDGIAARLTQMALRFDQRFGRTFDVACVIEAFSEHRATFDEQFPRLFNDVLHAFPPCVAPLVRPA